MKSNNLKKPNKNLFRLILNSNIFLIPSNSRFLSDIKPEIYFQLLECQYYVVKSNVRNEIFDMFLNNWLYDENPCINNNNISEFNQLSEEFDRMKDIIQMYQSNNTQTILFKENIELKSKIKEKRFYLQNSNQIYSQIISIIFNQINKDTFPQFFKKNGFFYSYCFNNDIESINLMTRKHITQKKFFAILNETDKTAILSNCSTCEIPKSVIYKSQEYIITTISALCFKLKSITHLDLSKNTSIQIIDNNAFSTSNIKEISIPSSVIRIGKSAFSNTIYLTKINFPENSNLKIIEENAFNQSSLKSLSIPSSVIELKEGWCKNTPNLIDVKVMPNNKYFSNYDNKFIIRKSYEENDQFDILVFCNRDVEEAIIPSFIKKIEPYAFSDCKNLKKITFSKDSELRLIEKFVFANTSIEEIIIPSKVIKISEKCFLNCDKLKNCVIFENSELRVIEAEVFSGTKIESIFIPSNVADLKKDCFNGASNLKEINISQNNKTYSSYNKELILKNEYQNYNLIYALPNLETVEIPSFVNIISPYVFYNSNLKKVIFLDKSELKIIGDNAFYCSKIEEIFIPSHVKQIQDSAFEKCKNLNRIEFAKDSELESINENTFCKSSINEISIPSHVKLIDNCAFYSCKNLKKVEFSENSELKCIECNAFGYTSIKQITLPSSLISLKDYCFNKCDNIEKINFQSNSKIQSIGSFAFNNSLESISLPSSVIELKEDWCDIRTDVNVMPNNKMFTNYKDTFIIGKSCIENDIFDIIIKCRPKVEYAIIPSFIKILRPDAFRGHEKIKTIEFEKNSNVSIIESSSFKTPLEKITIPFRVSKISNGTFSNGLKIVIFEQNSNLKLIEQFSFAFTSIGSIFIPPHVKTIQDYAFTDCKKLKIIEIAENSELSTFRIGGCYNDFHPDIIMIPANLCNKIHIKNWMDKVKF